MKEPSIDNKPIFSYRYGRYLSNGSLVIAFALLLGGLYLFIGNMNKDYVFGTVGFVMICAAISAFIPAELFQVNFETREYRNCVNFLGFKKGEWKSLKDVQYLSIITKRKSIYLGRGLMGAAEDQHFEDCNLRFFIKAGYYIDIEDFDDKLEGVKLGKIIAQGLDLKFIDATVKPATFI